MTFTQICSLHEAGKVLSFKHSDLLGVMSFDGDGELNYRYMGKWMDLPFWLSDFDRDDWFIVSNEWEHSP